MSNSSRWNVLTDDPNDLGVVQERIRWLSLVKSGSKLDRIEYLTALAKGKKVLDVGIVEHSRDFVNTPSWLHQYIAKASSECLGVDILNEEVEYIKSLGFNVQCHDLTQTPLDDTFEVIICGEVLEHIDSPGMFLRNLTKMLSPKGVIAITVPNPWYINASIKASFGREPFVDSVDHVAWYDAATIMELGARCGLQLTKYSYFNITVASFRSFKANLMFFLKPLWFVLGCKPELFSKTLVYEFQRN